jgi:3-oxoacyl-[acyl-carrier-protein] synthase-3
MLLELDAPQGLRDSAGRIATEAATREWVAIERMAPRSAAAESRIESVGIALPEHEVTTAELIGRCRRAGRIDLERLTGIRSRRVCSAGETSLSLAVRAGRDCLAQSRYQAADLDIVISCSITRFVDGLKYRFEPAMSHAIAAAIGASRARSFDVANACAGMLTGVYILDHMIRSGAVRRGMVVSGEYITSIAENAVNNVRTIASRQLASLTVGDSGAAVILDGAQEGSGGRIHAADFVTLSEHSGLCIGKPCRNAAGASMYTSAKKLHQHAIANAAPVMQRALERAKVAVGEIDHVIPHQTSARAIRRGTREVGEQLGGLPRNVVYNLEQLGNTASTTHFVALKQGLDAGRFGPGDRVMLLSFASGIVIGAVIFTVGDLGGTHACQH